MMSRNRIGCAGRIRTPRRNAIPVERGSPLFGKGQRMKPQFITENVVRRSVSAMPQALRVSSEEVIPPARRDRGHSVLRATYGSSLEVELRGMQVAHPHLSRGANRSSTGAHDARGKSQLLPHSRCARARWLARKRWLESCGRTTGGRWPGTQNTRRKPAHETETNPE